MFQFTKRISFIFFVLSLTTAFYINFMSNPTWVETQLQYQTYSNELGQLAYRASGQENLIKNPVPYNESPDFHFGIWSLLPALVAIVLCLMTREPLVALFGGIVVGAVMLGRFDITHEVFIPNIGTSSAASILILYLWLLGGLMGMWAKTGAAKAFAEHMSQHYVKGPRSAKVVTWFLGLVFFQGGTMSTVLVGTTVNR